MFVLLIITAAVYDFLNGFHDSSNIVATVISSRALKPRTALSMTAAAEFAAPFIFGTAVAQTIGNDLLISSAITWQVVVAATLAAVIWNLFTWWVGMPSSSSHALVGGLVGAAISSNGVEVIQWYGLVNVVIALFISPPLGMLIGFIGFRLVLFLWQGSGPRANLAFRRLQVPTSLILALAHGTNDSQKTMGIITLGLMAEGLIREFQVQTWVIALSAAALSLGTALGGWRLIRTLGGKVYKIRPVHSFTSQTAATLVVLGATILGGPVSTTQVVGSAIIGAGAAERLSKVRWQIARDILATWLITIPSSALVSALVFQALVRL